MTLVCGDYTKEKNDNSTKVLNVLQLKSIQLWNEWRVCLIETIDTVFLGTYNNPDLQ